ncbi:hypothetical protein J7M22_15200 [Candidatus Poribacteria bacterium]|nr:hypothetical protein [Candidatus Poribacteria bacterium]
MKFKHKNHLLSGYLTLAKQIREVRSIICEGEPISGTGMPMEPLPQEKQDKILRVLKLISDRFEKLVAKFAPEELEESGRRQNASVTKMWASIVLRNIRETLESIHPRNFERKFGDLSPKEKELLKAESERMIEELDRLLREI